MLERIYFESVWLRGPGFADEFVWGEASEGFEPPGEVVGVDEVAQVGSQLVVAVLLISSDFEEVERICHRALVFSRGQVAAEIPRYALNVAVLTAAASGGNWTARHGAAS